MRLIAVARMYLDEVLDEEDCPEEDRVRIGISVLVSRRHGSLSMKASSLKVLSQMSCGNLANA